MTVAAQFGGGARPDAWKYLARTARINGAVGAGAPGAFTALSRPLPFRRPRHPGSTAEAHPDDLAVCRACAEPPSPARPWGCCQVPTCPPPPGSSVTTQRRGRSQAGPLDSWGQGRLHEHQPKLKCLFLLPCWLRSCPCAPPPIIPTPPAHLWSALRTPRGPDVPRGCKREQRSSWGPERVQTF